MLKKILALFVAIILLFPAIPTVFAANGEDDSDFGRGMADMTDEQWAEFNASLPYIVDVRPNEIALARVEDEEIESQAKISKFSINSVQNDDEDAVEIDTFPIGDEMLYSYHGESTGGATDSPFPLTSSVDVSKQLSFPPIGDQGSYESCVSWSLAYYQLTNNTNVARGLNAKSSATSTTPITANVMSPRWTYAHTNLGKNIPTYYDEACASIMTYGSPNCTDYPLAFSSTNIQQWSTSTTVWSNTIKNEPERIAYANINTSGVVTGTSDDVTKLKRILSNGYVVTIPTYVDSYVYTKNTTGSVSGLRYRANTSYGGHAMTVVGYDDDFWVDVNGNGTKNPGETGAFKIANSWGTANTNYTSGYLWIPYDALGATSGVSGATTARLPAFTGYYYVQAKKSYDPLLVAEVQIATAKRDQVSLTFGISSTTATSPQSTLDIVDYYKVAFHNAGASWLTGDGYTSINRNFSGGTAEETATFSFDLTPLIRYRYYYSGGLQAKSDVKLYITATDTINDSYPVKLLNVKIVEPITGNNVTSTDTSTLTANGSSVTKTANFQITPALKTSPTQDIAVTFTNPLLASSITSSNFAVKDKNGATVSGVTSAVINNKLMVYAPTNGYNLDSKYELQFGNTISSIGGNKLATAKSFLFYVMSRYYYPVESD